MSDTQRDPVNPDVTKVDIGGKRTTDTEVELAEKLNELIERVNQLQRRNSDNAE